MIRLYKKWKVDGVSQPMQHGDHSISVGPHLGTIPMLAEACLAFEVILIWWFHSQTWSLLIITLGSKIVVQAGTVGTQSSRASRVDQKKIRYLAEGFYWDDERRRFLCRPIILIEMTSKVFKSTFWSLGTIYRPTCVATLSCSSPFYPRPLSRMGASEYRGCSSE